MLATADGLPLTAALGIHVSALSKTFSHLYNAPKDSSVLSRSERLRARATLTLIIFSLLASPSLNFAIN